MRALMSVCLSICILVSSVSPALAQVQSASSSLWKEKLVEQMRNQLVFAGALNREQIKKELISADKWNDEAYVDAVYTDYLAEYRRAYEQERKDVAAGMRFCEANQYGKLGCTGNFEAEVRWIWEDAGKIAQLRKAVSSGERYEVPIHMEWDKNKTENYDLIAFAHGVLRWTLNDLMKGRNKVDEDEYITYTYYVSRIVEVYDVSSIDREDLKTFLETILKHGNGKCNGANGFQRTFHGSKVVSLGTVWEKDRAARETCEKLSEAMVLYGSLYLNAERGSAEASNLIYKTVKEVYDEDFGAIALQSGIGSLLMIDTPTSVNKIYDLLMKDTVKERKWYAGLKEILKLLSLEEWNKKGIAGVNAIRGGAGNYLNETGIKLQYVDRKEAKANGLSDFNIDNAQNAIPDIQVKYNLPYGNVLEDIGVMIASYKGYQTRGLIKRIKETYLQHKHLNGMGDKLHMPLIVGIYSVLPQTSVNKPLYNADWWDLNEGTQRRVNNLAGVAAGFKARGKDEAKLRRSLDNHKVQQLGFWGDIFLTAVFMGMLVMSVPSIVRGAGALMRHAANLRAIRVARIRVTGHGRVLNNVRANMKARGVTRQRVKATKAHVKAKAKKTAPGNTRRASASQAKTASRAEKSGTTTQARQSDVAQMPEELLVEDAQGNTLRYNTRTGTATPVKAGGVKTGTVEVTEELFTETVGGNGGGAAGAASRTARTTVAQQPVMPRPVGAVAAEETAAVDVEGIQTQIQSLRNGALKGKNINVVYVERGGWYYGMDGVEVRGNYPTGSVVAVNDGRLFVRHFGSWSEMGRWKAVENPAVARSWGTRLHDWWINQRVGFALAKENINYALRGRATYMTPILPAGTIAPLYSPAVAQVEMMQAGRALGQLTRGAGVFSRTAQSANTVGKATQTIGNLGKTTQTAGSLAGFGGLTWGFPAVTGILREPGAYGHQVHSPYNKLAQLTGVDMRTENWRQSASAPSISAVQTAPLTSGNEETAPLQERAFSWTKIFNSLNLKINPQTFGRGAAITLGMTVAGLAVFNVLGLTATPASNTLLAGTSLLAGFGPVIVGANAKSQEQNTKQTPASNSSAGKISRGPATAKGYEAEREANFKFTVEPKQERILDNVKMVMDPAFETSGYNRLTLSEGNGFELRSYNRGSSKLRSFYLELVNTDGALWKFLQSPAQMRTLTHPLVIKIESKSFVRKNNWVVLDIELGDNATSKVPVKAQVEKSLLPKDVLSDMGKLRVNKDGSIYYSQYGKMAVMLDNFRVRLPKGNIREWVAMLQALPNTPFTLVFHATGNKMNWITKYLSFNMLGIGKTLAALLVPLAGGALSAAEAVGALLVINNLIPYTFSAIFRSKLKHYNDASLVRNGLLMMELGYVGAAVFSLLLPQMSWNTTLIPFLLSLTLVTIGTNMARIGQDPLIVANLKTKDAKKAKDAASESVTYDRAWFRARLQQVQNRLGEAIKDSFKKNQNRGELSWRLTSQMWKNLGGIIFFASPFLVNLLSGEHFDFRHMFPVFALTTLITTIKVFSLNLKENIPNDPNMLQEQVENFMENTLISLWQGKEAPTAKQVKDKVRDLYKLLEKWTSSVIRQDKNLNDQDVRERKAIWAKQYWHELVNQLGLSQEQAQKMEQMFNETLDQVEGPRDWPPRFSTVLWAALGAMALFTFTEMGVATGFSFEVKSLFTPEGSSPDIALIGAVSSLWYVAMAASRYIGNWMSRMQLRPGTMYMVSSSSTILGIGLMMAGILGGSTPLVLTSAFIACIGIGNFFSQVSKYIKDIDPDSQRQSQLWMGYTMIPSSLATWGIKSWLQDNNLALVGISLGALILCLGLTGGLLSQSSLVQAIKQNSKAQKDTKSDRLPDLDDAAPAN